MSTGLEVRYPEFSRRITEQMDKKSVSLRELSEATKISYEMIRRYTAGYAMPRQKGMKNLADVLGVSASWLQFGEGKIENNNNQIHQSHITGNVSQINHNHQVCNHTEKNFLECENENLKIIPIADNSMSPIIPQGSPLWTDTADTVLQNGKTYLVEYGGLQAVRRLFAEADGQIRLKPYHADYSETTLPAEQIRIIGRVVRWCVED